MDQGCKRELSPEQAITQLLNVLVLKPGVQNSYFKLSFRRKSLCLQQRGQKISTMSATRQMPASSPAFLPPAPSPLIFAPQCSRQQGCPSRAGPVHSPVQSQPEHTREDLWGLWGSSRVGEEKARTKVPVPSFHKVLVAVWAHHGQNWQHQRISYGITKIKANSVPLTPRRTEIPLSHCQLPRGSSCSPPDSPAAPSALRWELQRGCWRKDNLHPLLEILHLSFQAEIPLICRRSAAH